MRPKKQYTAEFKAEALRMIEESEKSIPEVAAELGINHHTLRGWRKQSLRPSSGVEEASVPETPEQELARLRRELRQVSEERDILKKAIGYFASHRTK